MLKYLISTILSLLVFCGSAAADIYRYADSKGELHFVDEIGKVPKKYRNQVVDAGELGNISVMDAVPLSASPARRPPGSSSEQESRPVGSDKVEVFMTSWCGYCKKMVRFLNEKGIPYTAYDIEKDPAAARIHKELGGRGVPLVRIGSRVIHGYNPEGVMSIYNSGK